MAKIMDYFETNEPTSLLVAYLPDDLFSVSLSGKMVTAAGPFGPGQSQAESLSVGVTISLFYLKFKSILNFTLISLQPATGTTRVTVQVKLRPRPASPRT